MGLPGPLMAGAVARKVCKGLQRLKLIPKQPDVSTG